MRTQKNIIYIYINTFDSSNLLLVLAYMLTPVSGGGGGGGGMLCYYKASSIVLYYLGPIAMISQEHMVAITNITTPDLV